MTKSAKICPFIVVFGLYLMSNSLSSMAHIINLPEVSVCVTLASLDILLRFRWYELRSKDAVFWLQLPVAGLISPSLGTFPLPLLELDCNSRLAATLCLCL